MRIINKIARFLYLYLLIFILEAILNLLMDFVFHHLFQYYVPITFGRELKFMSFFVTMRLVYFTIPIIMTHIFLIDFLNRNILYKPLIFSIINMVSYNVLFVIFRAEFRNRDFAEFSIMCIFCFVSPIILGRFVFFRKTMNNLYNKQKEE